MYYTPLFVWAICLVLYQSAANADSSYSFWFLPGAPITKYQSTMVVPTNPGSGLHAVWPGLENDSGGFVFQSVISDSNGAGSWTFFVEYCCNPNYVSNPVKIYPGDSITSTFTLGSNGFWTDAWSISPGPAGIAAGEKAQSGSSANSFSSEGSLTRAVLAIELKGAGTWDFGQVQWKDITIVSSTTSAWCSTHYAAVPADGFSYTVSGGTATPSGNTMTCGYPSLTFVGPK